MKNASLLIIKRSLKINLNRLPLLFNVMAPLATVKLFPKDNEQENHKS